MEAECKARPQAHRLPKRTAWAAGPAPGATKLPARIPRRAEAWTRARLQEGEEKGWLWGAGGGQAWPRGRGRAGGVEAGGAGPGWEGVPGRVATRAAEAHRAARLVVVLVHGRARVRSVLAGVRELPGHEHPKVGVLTAAAPLPTLAGWPLVMGVAATDGGGAFCAGARDGEGHASGGDGVDEGRFASGCVGGVGGRLGSIA